MPRLFESLENRQLLSACPFLAVVPEAVQEKLTAVMGKAAKPTKPGATHASFSLDTTGTKLTVSNASSLQVNDFGDGSVVVIDKSLSSTDPNYMRSFVGLTDLTVNGTSGADILSGGFETVNVTFNGGGGNDQYSVSNNGVYNVTINDTQGTNSIMAKNNNAAGTFDIYTNAQSTVSVGASPYPINVFRS